MQRHDPRADDPIGASKGLQELAEETELFSRLFAIAETISSGGVVGAVEAVEKAAEKLTEETGRPDIRDMACKAIALLNSLGAWRGFTAFTRINYEECVCGSLWTLYRNHWVDRHERWQRYQGVSDLGLGTFLDALKAVQAGSKQCKEKLKGWKDANKGVIEK